MIKWGGIRHATDCYCGRCRSKRAELAAKKKPSHNELSQDDIDGMTIDEIALAVTSKERETP